MLRILTAVLFLLLLPMHSSSAASLVTDNGILKGATGIDVQGTLFDVSFADGTCPGLYNGCDLRSDFPFGNRDIANGALLKLLFLIEANPIFNRSPTLVQGCSNPDVCDIFTPFSVNFLGGVSIASLRLTPVGLTVRPDLILPSRDTSRRSDNTYAVWSQSPPTTVPEPSTLMLLGIGLLSQRWLRTRGKRVPV
ncbi:PEP-CTERM sorting domain-containing protein [Methylomonas sp. HW2-6]|uniref:PEP-CTERM sorting domain-containing protein n=1 Tax=Methylomonas sp. HW2-6 TaxID=3376687 RepID=UPI0040423C91